MIDSKNTDSVDELEINPIILDEGLSQPAYQDTLFGKTNLSDLRESVLVSEADPTTESKKRLVKSIIQRLEQGDKIQKLNDLLDNLVILYSKGLEEEMRDPLEDVKTLLLNEDHPYKGLALRDELFKLEQALDYKEPEEVKTELLRNIEKVK